jgi:hypothetical protein
MWAYAQGSLDGAVIDPQVGVAVRDEKPAPEQVERSPDRSGRPCQPRPIERVSNVQPETSAVSHRRLDLLAEMSDTENDPSGAVACKQPQLVKDERLAGD